MFICAYTDADVFLQSEYKVFCKTTGGSDESFIISCRYCANTLYSDEQDCGETSNTIASYVIALGMCFGENGFFRIPFDNYEISEAICSISLIFVMFYGGFGTNLKTARPVMARSFVLSTVGVVVTALLTGAGAHYFLGLGWKEGLLMGSVVASTDAASVFNVLRSKKLSLKDHTDSMLELESGSNDPISYMLTILMVSLISGDEISVPVMLTKQILFGIVCGLLIGKVALYIMDNIDFRMKQGRTVFVFAVAIAGYALASLVGGNGYLSVYLCGIFMGNGFIQDKKDMVRFFDIVTEIAQMVIFFLLGLLVTPVHLPEVFFRRWQCACL